MLKIISTIFLLSTSLLFSNNKMLVPMDDSQNNHLKAYGVTYVALQANLKCSWLLNYKGGSFILDYSPAIRSLCIKKGVTIELLSQADYLNLKISMKDNNAAETKLEKTPKIAVYTPPNTNPWADAVTLVLEYAEIPYTKLYDKEVLKGDLKEFDWLHLHHEDFTGQFSKFWVSHRHQPWFQAKMATFKRKALQAGFSSVAKHKLAVAKTIQTHVSQGLFLFAMCAATETLDVALSADGIDIVDAQIDGTPIDIEGSKTPNYNKTFAFEDFLINHSISENSYSDIDYNQVNTANKIETKDFLLFDFSAKLDPIHCLLVQNHRSRLSGFYGQTTSFNKAKIKDGVTILAESTQGSVRYLHGNFGKGAFSFYGGHAPEDKNHYVGDKAPNMELHKNSPGYRLILNNILFPSAKPPKKKT